MIQKNMYPANPGWQLPLNKLLATLLLSFFACCLVYCSVSNSDSPDNGQNQTNGNENSSGNTNGGNTNGGTTDPPQPSSRLQPSQLQYQGAFRLPDAFGWGARGMTYYTEGDGGAGALLVIGNDQNQAEFAQLSIPEPLQEDNWAALPEAAMLTAMTDFDGDIVENEVPDTALASGIEFVPLQGTQTSDKLYGSLDNWYGVVEETHRTVWFCEMDGSNPRGPFHVGPEDDNNYHGNRSGDFLFSVPQWYADQYFGGRFLVTGKTRGAYYGSQGPSLIAFQPWQSESPSGNLDALLVLYYRINIDCASPDVTNKDECDFPEFTFCDKWEGGAFLESGDARTILLLGSKGLGSNFYGPPPDAGYCLDSSGYHCDPFERQVIFLDVDELGEAAQGTRDPWTVVPYATWRPDEFFLGDDQGQTCGEVAGVAADQTGSRLFMIEKGLGDNNNAVVHVWSFAP